VIKKLRKRGGYSPVLGCENTTIKVVTPRKQTNKKGTCSKGSECDVMFKLKTVQLFLNTKFADLMRYK